MLDVFEAKDEQLYFRWVVSAAELQVTSQLTRTCTPTSFSTSQSPTELERKCVACWAIGVTENIGSAVVVSEDLISL